MFVKSLVINLVAVPFVIAYPHETCAENADVCAAVKGSALLQKSTVAAQRVIDTKTDPNSGITSEAGLTGQIEAFRNKPEGLFDPGLTALITAFGASPNGCSAVAAAEKEAWARGDKVTWITGHQVVEGWPGTEGGYTKIPIINPSDSQLGGTVSGNKKIQVDSTVIIMNDEYSVTGTGQYQADGGKQYDYIQIDPPLYELATKCIYIKEKGSRSTEEVTRLPTNARKIGFEAELDQSIDGATNTIIIAKMTTEYDRAGSFYYDVLPHYAIIDIDGDKYQVQWRHVAEHQEGTHTVEPAVGAGGRKSAYAKGTKVKIVARGPACGFQKPKFSTRSDCKHGLDVTTCYVGEKAEKGFETCLDKYQDLSHPSTMLLPVLALDSGSVEDGTQIKIDGDIFEVRSSAGRTLTVRPPATKMYPKGAPVIFQGQPTCDTIQSCNDVFCGPDRVKKSDFTDISVYNDGTCCESSSPPVTPAGNGDSCQDISVRTQTRTWGRENSWQLVDEDENNVCKVEKGLGNWQQKIVTCNVCQGKTYKMLCEDSMADGWHGGYVQLPPVDGQEWSLSDFSPFGYCSWADGRSCGWRNYAGDSSDGNQILSDKSIQLCGNNVPFWKRSTSISFGATGELVQVRQQMTRAAPKIVTKLSQSASINANIIYIVKTWDGQLSYSLKPKIKVGGHEYDFDGNYGSNGLWIWPGLKEHALKCADVEIFY